VVTPGVVANRRIVLFGKPERRIHRCKPTDARQVSIGFSKKRAKLYATLCVLRMELQKPEQRPPGQPAGLTRPLAFA